MIKVDQLKDRNYQLKDGKVDLYQESRYILTFSIIFDLFWSLFDFFRSLSNFLIKSGHVLIDLVATINLDSKNFDQKVD